jgi:hypothetical protein
LDIADQDRHERFLVTRLIQNNIVDRDGAPRINTLNQANSITAFSGTLCPING